MHRNFGLNSTSSGFPDVRAQFDISSRFKVIQKDASIKDEDINETIQREGGRLGRGRRGEGDWYFRKHPDRLREITEK